jgi:hypothetical protein
MSVRLDQPLASNPNADEQKMFIMPHGNILKSHGRKNTAHIVLRFDPAQHAAARTFLRALGATLTTGSDQLANAMKVRAVVYKDRARAAWSRPQHRADLLPVL